MSDMTTFPETWEEFERSYGFADSEEVYTNGSRLIPSFRVKQWLDHVVQYERKKGEWIDKKDSISRLVWGECSICGYESAIHYCFCPNCGCQMNGGEDDE